MTYKYVAYDAENKVVKGTLGVTSESAAADSLERSGLKIVSLRKAREWNIRPLLPTFYGVKPRQVILVSRQIAMLLERGSGFLTALRLARDQTTSRGLKEILADIIRDVGTGVTFSAAVAKHPQAFPLSYSRMMKVGEETGKLEVVLKQMAASMERDEKAKRRVRAALTYPAFVMLLGLITVVVMVTAVLPPLTRMFTEFDAQLPWTTELLTASIDFVASYKFYLLGAVVILISVVPWYLRRPSGRYQFERLLLKLPVIGRVVLIHNMSNFSRIMHMLLAAGLPMTEVVSVARQSAQSEVLRQALGNIPKKLFQGQSLSRAMKADRLFPDMLVQMVTIGEETNTLESSFEAIADRYELESEDSLAALTSILEPLALLLVGLVIGFIAVSVMMPMYSVYNVIG